MQLLGPDGTGMAVERTTHGRSSAEFDILAAAEPTTFDRCPICLAPEPTSREHVPPEALGGSVFTRTCERCNNSFGSGVEPELVDWWEDAVGSVSLAHDGVAGARRATRLLLRQNDDGEPVILLGRVDDAIRDKFGPGTEISVNYRRPDRARYRLAALKSAYLGACLLLRSIPETPEAAGVRAELIAARDAPRRAQLEESEHCAALQLWRTHGPAAPGEIALVRIRPSDGSEPLIAISLARTLFMSWPVGGAIRHEGE